MGREPLIRATSSTRWRRQPPTTGERCTLSIVLEREPARFDVAGSDIPEGHLDAFPFGTGGLQHPDQVIRGPHPHVVDAHDDVAGVEPAPGGRVGDDTADPQTRSPAPPAPVGLLVDVDDVRVDT